MRAIILRCVLMVLGAMIWTGCAHVAGGVSSSDIPLCGRTYTVLGNTKGTSSRIRLFGFLPISGSNSSRRAMDAARRRHHADALINITVENFSHHYILFTRDATVVEATAVRLDR